MSDTTGYYVKLGNVRHYGLLCTNMKCPTLRVTMYTYEMSDTTGDYVLFNGYGFNVNLLTPYTTHVKVELIFKTKPLH